MADEDIVRLARQAAGEGDPEAALRAVAELRRRLESVEASQVDRALAAGSSWRRVGAALGVSRQAAHRKHASRAGAAPATAEPARGERQRLVVTGEARRTVYHAREEAAALGSPAVRPEHLLLGLLRQPGGAAGRALAAVGVSLPEVRDRAGEVTDSTGDARAGGAPSPDQGAPPISAEVRAVFEQSLREAVRRGEPHLGVEHLLLALLRAGGAAVDLLAGLGASAEAVEAQVPAPARGD